MRVLPCCSAALEHPNRPCLHKTCHSNRILLPRQPHPAAMATATETITQVNNSLYCQIKTHTHTHTHKRAHTQTYTIAFTIGCAVSHRHTHILQGCMGCCCWRRVMGVNGCSRSMLSGTVVQYSQLRVEDVQVAHIVSVVGWAEPG